jgi:chitodextrinase
MPFRRLALSAVLGLTLLALWAPGAHAAPPAAPTGLAAAPGLNAITVQLRWDAVAGATRYRVYRSSFRWWGTVPPPRDEIAVVTALSHLDTQHDGRVSWWYTVRAENAAGELSANANEVSIKVVGDTAAPTATLVAPSGGTTASGTTTVTGSAVDDYGVRRIELYVDDRLIADYGATSPYSAGWDTTHLVNGSSHVVRVTATDLGGNSHSATATVTVQNTRSQSLHAGYGFDEGAGTVAGDSSGAGRSGTIYGASWTDGRSGSALRFDGRDDRVDLPPLHVGPMGAQFYDRAFTLEAWVRKTGTKRDTAVLGSWRNDQNGGPMLWVSNVDGRYRLVLNRGESNYLDSGRAPVAGEWQHLAATYDGATARFFVNGAEVASRPFAGSVGSSDAWRIGSYGATPTGFFDGSIDGVRIYRRALSVAEIRDDLVETGGAADTSPPTTPGAFIATGATSTAIATSWAAASDDVGVAVYVLYRDGDRVGSATSTSFTFTGLSCGVGYELEVAAEDAGGNLSPTAVVQASTEPCLAEPDLVAAYAFDEGAGTAAGDASGNGKIGSLLGGASWSAAGKLGGALQLDGVSGRVQLPALGTFYNAGFTLEAWVKPAYAKKDAAVVGSWQSGGPMIWAAHTDGNWRGTLGSGLSNYLDSARAPAAGAWQHLAFTYDGATARFYVDASPIASRAWTQQLGTANAWRIGAYGANSPVALFAGLVDEVRIYRRALSAEEIERDMNSTGELPSDTVRPTAPTSFDLTGRSGVALETSWSGATDDVGVTTYNLYRNGVRVASTGATSHTFTGLACGTTYELAVESEDAADNVSAARKLLTASTEACQATNGLVAAYGFDEGAGTTIADSSGAGRGGTAVNLEWIAGRYGSGLYFFDTGDKVVLPPLGTFYKRAFTYEAWVKRSTRHFVGGKDMAIVGTWLGTQNGGSMLWVDHVNGKYAVTFNKGIENYLVSSFGPVRDTWQHVAATYDGTTARVYVDGVAVASRLFSGNAGDSNTWLIGSYGTAQFGTFFDGTIDEVRIYDRALTGAEIQADMADPISP